MPKSPVVVNEAGVPLKTAIENLNSENMELKAKVGDLHYFNTLKYSLRVAELEFNYNFSPERISELKFFHPLGRDHSIIGESDVAWNTGFPSFRKLSFGDTVSVVFSVGKTPGYLH